MNIIRKKSRYHILFRGLCLVLMHGYDDVRGWFWKITSNDSFLVREGFIEEGNGLYNLPLPQQTHYSYSAYETKMYCMYLGFKYEVENIRNGLFIFYPEEHATRKRLNLHGYDDRRIKIPYDNLMATTPIIWEERKPIPGFIFDVIPVAYLFKDNSYVEENL